MTDTREEALRREVVEQVRWYANAGTSDEIAKFATVRAAFNALRDHYQARPTFEGDEAEVIRQLRARAGDPLIADALALLDAKDAEIMSKGAASSLHFEWYRQAKAERDEALARAERAEQALADRDAVIVGLMDCLIETVGTPRVEALHGKRLDAAYDAAKTFLPAPEPVKVDPLVMLGREMVLADGVIRTGNQEAAIREGRAAQHAAIEHEQRLRAALAARGGKIVFEGEGK